MGRCARVALWATLAACLSAARAETAVSFEHVKTLNEPLVRDARSRPCLRVRPLVGCVPRGSRAPP
jgi:hypothetical protein